MSGTSNGASEHARVAELLPWYANETLDDAEASRVGRHLDRCEACRLDVERLREVGARWVEDRERAWTPGDERLAAVLARIDAAEAGRDRAQRSPAARPGAFRAWLAGLSTPTRWVIGVESLAVAGLGALLLQTPAPQGDGAFETRSAPAAATASATVRLQLVFAPEATEAEMRSLLLQADLALVDGPSPRGVYSAALGAEASLADALATLRASERVRLAEALAP